MDMTGYLGKKVDLVCKDGEIYSGYVFDILDAEESGIGCDAIDLPPLDVMKIVTIPVADIDKMQVDDKFKEFDFRS